MLFAIVRTVEIGAEPRCAGPVRRGDAMVNSTIEQRALSLLRTFERAGKPVSRVTIEGKRIELVLSQPKEDDEFARIDMRHD